MNLKFSPIKILIFLSFFISITNAYTYHGVLSRILPPSDFNPNSKVTLLGTGYIKYNNKIYSYTPNNIEAFNAEKSKYTSNSYFRFKGDVPSDILLISPREDTLYCQDINDREKYNWSTTDCLNPGEGPATYSGYFWTKVKIGYYAASVLTYVTTCKANENFNSQTQKCEAPCQKGQSWDVKNNICFHDCTDINSNKWGFSNGMPQGQCIDCSDKKTSNQVVDCFCMASSGSVGVHSVFEDYGNGFKGGTCEDGSTFPFKDPDAPSVDNNQTADPANPNPYKPDNNSTAPADPNNGSTSGGSSGSSGGDNAGSQTTPNQDNPNGGGNGNTTIINNSNGDNKSNDFGTFYGKIDYKDLQSKANDSTNDLSGAINKFTSEFNSFKGGVGQFIDNVTGNGLSTFQKQDSSNSCSKSFLVEIGNYEKTINFDLCKTLEPLKPLVYYIVYVSSFILLLVLSFKLIIFAF